MSDKPYENEEFDPENDTSQTDAEHYDYYQQEPRKRGGGGCGCWVAAITTLVVFVVLVGVGLFLPPVNLLQRLTQPQMTTLTSDTNAVTDSGLTLASYNLEPGESLNVSLSSVPMSRFLAGDATAGTWVPDALASIPPSLALQSPVYALAASENGATDGTEIAISVDLPPEAEPDIFDLYGWDTQTHEWQFIPAHPVEGKMVATVDDAPERVALFQATPMDQPRVLAAYDVTQALSQDAARLATIIAPAGLQPVLDGTLAGTLAAGFDLNAGYLVTPSIRNYSDPRATDADTISAILSNSTTRREHAAQLAAFAGSGYDGVLIDYRDLPVDQRDNFSVFAADLGEQLDNAGLLLIISVPMAQNQNGEWNTGAYDWQALGAAADYVQVALSPDPNIYIPGADRPLEALLRWGVGEISRDKFLLGLTALSQSQPLVAQAGDGFTAISYDQALSALGDVSVEAERTAAGTINPGGVVQARLDGYGAAVGAEPNTMQPYLDYMNESGVAVARMWLTTPDALRYRMDRTLPFALGGVAFDDLMSNGLASGLLDAILDYKVQNFAQPREPGLALRWTIQGVDGVIDQVTTGLGEPLVATIQAPDGNYAINVEVVSGDESASQRSGASVAVFAPTATPTPLPTATPTPTPAPTSVPVQQVANAAAPSGGGQAAVAPGAGSIVGGFEYGGHVTSTATGAVGAMQRAGMNWMKVQIRFSPGGGDAVAGSIRMPNRAALRSCWLSWVTLARWVPAAQVIWTSMLRKPGQCCRTGDQMRLRSGTSRTLTANGRVVRSAGRCMPICCGGLWRDQRGERRRDGDHGSARTNWRRSRVPRSECKTTTTGFAKWSIRAGCNMPTAWARTTTRGSCRRMR